MAKLSKVPDSYPESCRRDGVDVSKVRDIPVPPVGLDLNTHREWRDSVTGKRTDPPDWAHDDYYRPY